MATFLQLVVDECYRSLHFYLQYYEGNEHKFINDMAEYVFSKRYNSDFCDILPSIIANSIKHRTIVINHSQTDIDVSCFMPEYFKDTVTCSKCNLSVGSMILYRRSEHYDACLPYIVNVNHCICFLKSLSSR